MTGDSLGQVASQTLPNLTAVEEASPLPLPLTHRLLASMIGAHRPSVTTALGVLRERGLIDRRRDGTWILHGPPPRELSDLRRAAAVRPSQTS